jgi:hypothetical protein
MTYSVSLIKIHGLPLTSHTETNGELKMEERNERAWAVYSRVQKKLTGEYVSRRMVLTEMLSFRT